MTEHDKRRPGRPRNTHEDEPEHEVEVEKPKGTMVTYRPLDPGDPVTTVWAGESDAAGVTFEANVPKRVTRKDIIASAKTNPWFEVEGHPRAKRVRPTAEPITPPGKDIDPVALDDRKMIEDD
jgi:hypothetical protein